MARPVKVDFISDAKPVVTDIKKMSDALEDGADDLVTLGRKGDSAADDLRLLARQGRDAGDDVSDGMRKAREATGTFKEEAVANFSETASSFDGSLSGVADGIQGTFGGLASALPLPLGIAFGTIGAAGGALFQGLSDDAEASSERVNSAFDSMVDSGHRFLDATYIQSEAQKLLRDEGSRSYEDIKADADALGLSIADVALAYAGQSDAMRVVKERATELQRPFEQLGDVEGAIADPLAIRLGDVADQLGRVQRETDEARKRFDTYDQIEAKLDAAAKAGNRTADALDRIKPVDVAVNLNLPDPASVLAGYQQRFNAGGRRLTIVADVVDRQGRNVP